MLEVFILISLCKSIDSIAYDKGENSGKWKAYVVIAWLLTEFVVAFIIGSLGLGTLLAVVAAYPMAYLSYILIRSRLRSLPDKDRWIDELGQDVNQQ